MFSRLSRIMCLLVCVGLMAACGCRPAGSGTSGSGNDGTGGTGGSGSAHEIAFVTNGIADFWVLAQVGAEQAGRDLKVNVDVKMPADVADQKRIIEDLLSRGVEGIAISPIDPTNQAEIINQACGHAKVITHDSDAPGTDRLCYIGMKNYDAGRMCGQLVREAIPEGGNIMIFVGRLEQDNARLRRQGVIDELLGRDYDESRYDVPGEVLKGDKYVILDTRTDNFDNSRAKQNVEDALATYDDIDCMVGLFQYNPPLILEALRDADKLDEVKIVAFDEHEQTLEGIRTGEIHGTVVQNPYRYGYDSVQLLTKILNGESDAVPQSHFMDIPARQIRKDNVDAFKEELAGYMAKARASAKP